MGNFQYFRLYICPPPGITSASHVAVLGSGFHRRGAVGCSILLSAARLLSGESTGVSFVMDLYTLSYADESGSTVNVAALSLLAISIVCALALNVNAAMKNAVHRILYMYRVVSTLLLV